MLGAGGESTAPQVKEKPHWERPPETDRLFIFFAAEARASHTGPIQQKSGSGGASWNRPPRFPTPDTASALPPRPLAFPIAPSPIAPPPTHHPVPPRFAPCAGRADPTHPTAPTRPYRV